MTLGRIPIRWRLTLVFAAVLALVILIFGALLRLDVASSLDENVRESLRARADEVAALVQATGGDALLSDREGRLSETEESFAQVVDANGRVLGTTSPRLDSALLTPSQLSEARVSPSFVTIPQRDGTEHRAELLARPVEGDRIVIVGASLEDRDETVARLSAVLAIGGPIVLVLVSGLAYLLATLALRPVGAMRSRAADISGAPSGDRLPLPEARDEIYRLAETLNAMLDRIDAAMDRERSFVADASHELRTPLGILKAEIDLALADERSADELRAALVSAAEETDQLVRLAEDLLVLSRAERGGLPIRAEAVDLEDELAVAVEPFLSKAQGEGRDIALEVSGVDQVVADPVRLRQAVGNLVDNALRHGRGGVTVRGESHELGVTISVSDEGPGLPSDFASRAFERFSRSDAARTGSGTGLGLAIVAAIATAHGGEAHIVETRPATIGFVLPQPA